MAVQDGAEGQPVTERRGHVGDADIAVALALLLAPQLQVLDGGHRADPGPCRLREPRACGGRREEEEEEEKKAGKGAGGGGSSRPPSAGPASAAVRGRRTRAARSRTER